MLGAHTMASLSRAKRIPKLSSLLRSETLRKRQTPEQQRALILDFAAIHGLKIERHERPVI